MDCAFVCPFDESHDLTEYHIINKIGSSIADKTLQQELLHKADSLKSLNDITAFCENFESAKSGRDKLNKATVISGIEQADRRYNLRGHCCSNT